MKDGSVERDGASVLPASPSVPPDAGVTSAELLRNAVESAPIGIICVSGATGQYVFANETFARMVGRTREEVLQSDPFQIGAQVTHPDDWLVSRQAMELLGRGEADRYQYEKRLISKNGEVLWVSVHQFATRDAEGRLAFLTTHFTDIHERRSADMARARLEEQLRQAQKLEALGRLAGGVAHDFNNRLVVIMGYAQLLKERLPTASPLVAHTDRVLESSLRAAELTRQLLAYGRRQVLNPQVFDLSSTVDSMRRLLERLIGDDIELVTVFTAHHPFVVADPGQIEQVIINLAINARDAMPRGGRLMLETNDATLAPSEPGGLAQGDYVTLSVTDGGMGIPEDILPRIFEPFFTTKEVGRGTGLGLATVEGIVNQSGGAIRVESRVGRGTTFTIHLPRASELPVEAHARSPVAVARGSNFETVLVCDDDDDVRQLIVNVLSLRGYVVLQARSGKHALEIAASHAGPIHLLVTDLVMPELGGIELAAELRHQQPRMSIVYISGYTERVTLLSDQLESNTQFLQKPFMPSDLTRTVCSMLERLSVM
jgi:two-component system cell cycle sensor histidine kinase/response regulator CckA